MRQRNGALLLALSSGLVLCATSLPAEAPAGVEVRHTPRGDGREWALAETANFRIFHHQGLEESDRIARLAEAARSAALHQWFGDSSAPWKPRCDVYLYDSAADYSLATGKPPQMAGHSTVQCKDGVVTSRRIDLHCDDPNVFVGVLPHETAHVVLAGRFGVPRLPRWVDEGMAVLSEPHERVELHLNNLPRHRADGELFAVAELMGTTEYPRDGRRIGAFYAESVSLVEFLSGYEHKGPRVFARFLRDGLHDGFEAALQKYYDIRDFDDLQSRWQHYAFGQEVEAAP